jgi:hypothetical protein
MSSITSTIPTTIATPFARPGLRRITVDEYERIIRAGALNEPERVELIGGYMVDKMGKSAEHGYSTKLIIKALEALLPAGWTWRSEQPVRIPLINVAATHERLVARRQKSPLRWVSQVTQ